MYNYTLDWNAFFDAKTDSTYNKYHGLSYVQIILIRTEKKNPEIEFTYLNNNDTAF
jgi:hypothetical protein